jgi:hypothetical protein
MAKPRLVSANTKTTKQFDNLRSETWAVFKLMAKPRLMSAKNNQTVNNLKSEQMDFVLKLWENPRLIKTVSKYYFTSMGCDYKAVGQKLGPMSIYSSNLGL